MNLNPQAILNRLNIEEILPEFLKEIYPHRLIIEYNKDYDFFRFVTVYQGYIIFEFEGERGEGYQDTLRKFMFGIASAALDK